MSENVNKFLKIQCKNLEFTHSTYDCQFCGLETIKGLSVFFLNWTVNMNACLQIGAVSVDPLTNDQASVCVTCMFSANHWASKHQIVLLVYPWLYKAFWVSIYKKQTFVLLNKIFSINAECNNIHFKAYNLVLNHYTLMLNTCSEHFVAATSHCIAFALVHSSLWTSRTLKQPAQVATSAAA